MKKADRDFWLQQAKDAYSESTSYIETNYTSQWRDNLRLFQNKHKVNSKYYAEAYKARSKVFRPETRSAITRAEAGAAAAFFSSEDVVNVEAENPQDPMQSASAQVMRELMQYRLTKTIPWFLTMVGAFQDGCTLGAIASFQGWRYRERDIITTETMTHPVTGEPALNDAGEPLEFKVPGTEVLEDKPEIRLIPLENLRVSAAADWTDPINSSPYVIWRIPMFIGDILAEMDSTDPKTGRPKWKKLSKATIVASVTTSTTDLERQGNREKPEQAAKTTDFSIAWVHLNIIRDGDDDMVFYTLANSELLSDPKPLKEVFFTGKRPFAFGRITIETHKVYPDSKIELASEVQTEINEIANQRLDNVKLVLNKRWLVKSGRNVDTASLHRNVPGGVTLVTDPGDVQEINWPDVTASSFNEHDRLKIDFDSLMGVFNQSSVMSNRKLNETVGGMNILSGSSNALQEYTLRVFSETWVETVLNQLMMLEQEYETDLTVLSLAADKAKIFQRYGISQVTDEMLNQNLTLRVSVGVGATDPTQKVGKLLYGARTVAEIASMPGSVINAQEIAKEVFGYLGWKDGGRFLQQAPQGGIPPEVMQQIQQAQQQLQQAAEKVKSDKAAADQAANQAKLLESKVSEGMTGLKAEGAILEERKKSAESQIAESLMGLKAEGAILEERKRAAMAEIKAGSAGNAAIESAQKGPDGSWAFRYKPSETSGGPAAALTPPMVEAAKKMPDGTWAVRYKQQTAPAISGNTQ